MNILFNTAKRDFLNGTLDWDAGGFKVMLVTNSYTPDPDHEFVASASAAEISGTGYVPGFGGAGRKVIANPTAVADQVNNRAVLDGDDVTWPAITAGIVSAAIIIKEVTSDADSKLVAFIDGGFPVTTDGTDLVLSWAALGILLLS